MTVFQLLHWNGSLKAMRERQCSRQVHHTGSVGTWVNTVAFFFLDCKKKETLLYQKKTWFFRFK